jgi:hypothetical protein
MRVVAAILLLGILAYGRAPTAAFQFDDFPAVVENPALLRPFSLSDLFRPSASGADYVRPVLFLSYRATEWAARLVDPTPDLATRSAAHHAGNLVLHLASALLVLALGRVLERRIGRRTAAPAAAALLYAVHPALSQGVYYVAARSTVLMTALALAAVALALRRPPTRRTRVGCLLATALALLTKEPALAIPVLILAAGRLTDPERRWPLREATLPAALAALASALFLARSAAHFQPPVLDFALIQVRAVARYAELLLVPHGLTADYGWVPPPAAAYCPFTPAFALPVLAAWLVAAAFLLALAATAILAGRRRPLAAAGSAWFALALLPTSSFFPIRDPIFEHHLIFAAPGFLFATADLGVAALALNPRTARGRRLATVAFAALLLLLAVQARARATAWQSERALWQDTLAQQPENARAAFNLAATLTAEMTDTRDPAVRAALRTEAEALYRRSLALHPDFAYGYELRAYATTNLGYLYLDAAHAAAGGAAAPRAERELDRAIAVLDTAVTRRVRSGAREVAYPPAFENLGRALFARARLRQASGDPRAAVDALRARDACRHAQVLAPTPALAHHAAEIEAFLRAYVAPPVDDPQPSG